MLSFYHHSLLSPDFELGKGNKLFQDQERLVINHVFFASPNQKEIVELTKIPQQTISRIVKSLVEKKVFIQSSRESTGSRGQPGYILNCNPEFAYSIGVGILSESVAIAVMDFQGNLVYSHEVQLQNMSVSNVMQQLKGMYNTATKDIDNQRILGIGVSLSGYFTHNNTRINTHHVLSEWAEIDIPKCFTEAFNLPTWLENDATAAAAGEGVLHRAENFRSFVYLFISKGFGGGVVTDRNIWRGDHGNAGEIGELLPPKVFPHPNLEYLRQILIKNDVDIQTLHELRERFDIEWPGVKEWIYKVKDALSLVASASSALLDPQTIIIGGHIPKALADALIQEIEIYTQNRRDSSRPTPALRVSATTADPVSIGAASIPFRELCLQG